MRAFLVVFLLTIIFTACIAGTSLAQPGETSTETPEASPIPMGTAATPPPLIIQNAMSTLRGLVDEGNYAGLGFTTREEAASSTPDGLLVRYFVPRSLLTPTSYSTNNDLAPQLVPSQIVVVPVLANGEDRSSVAIARYSDGWKAVSFGSPHLMRALVHARNLDGALNPTPRDYYAIVTIPGLERTFLAVNTTQGLYLIPIFSEPALKFFPGVRMRAAFVFWQLRLIMQNYNGQPG